MGEEILVPALPYQATVPHTCRRGPPLIFAGSRSITSKAAAGVNRRRADRTWRSSSACAAVSCATLVGTPGASIVSGLAANACIRKRRRKSPPSPSNSRRCYGNSQRVSVRERRQSPQERVALTFPAGSPHAPRRPSDRGSRSEKRLRPNHWAILKDQLGEGRFRERPPTSGYW